MAKKHLERAISMFHAEKGHSPSDALVAVHWKSFMIDPATAAGGEDYLSYNERRWGSDGWTQALRAKGRRCGAPFANWKVWPNTLDAHRLVRLAGERGGPEAADAVADALFAACYEQGRNISDHACLVEVGVACFAGGEQEVMSAEQLSAYLASAAGRDTVMQDCQAAASDGVDGVPLFLIQDGARQQQSYKLSGAQEPRVLLGVMNEVAGAGAVGE